MLSILVEAAVKAHDNESADNVIRNYAVFITVNSISVVIEMTISTMAMRFIELMTVQKSSFLTLIFSCLFNNNYITPNYIDQHVKKDLLHIIQINLDEWTCIYIKLRNV